MIFVRKLGYFAYVKSDEVYSCFKELGDHSGITLERRRYLNLQIEISRSKDIKTLWNNICLALSLLNFDKAKMQFVKDRWIFHEGNEETVDVVPGWFL